MKMSRSLSMFSLGLMVLGLISAGQAEPFVTEGRGGKLLSFPHGVASFADRLVRFIPGSPPAEPDFCDGESAVGPRNYTYQKDGKKFTSFGKGGIIVLEFTDNRLVDIEGDDLYVFEIGPTVEAMYVAISEDGQNWISVGRVAGNKASLDIAPYVKPGQKFRYIGLTDDPEDGRHSGRTGGADLDAVGAFGSVPFP